MENILQGIQHVAEYLDDIILTGATKAQHLETLDMVLGRLEEAGLREERRERDAHFSQTRLCTRDTGLTNMDYI